MMRKLAVVLLSGGLDSTTAAALAREQGFEVTALTVDYGQTHRREIDAARQVARVLDIAHRVVEVPLFSEIAWYSALTGSSRYSTPIDRSPHEMAVAIPITYVPLRNTFLLTLAAAGVESQVLHLIEVEGAAPSSVAAAVVIAANAIDYSGYPDCRPEFYAAAAEIIRLGSKLGTQHGISIRIETPLLDKTKADIVRLALALGAPLEHTWSCYAPGPLPCGRCDSCLLRAKGFADVGVPDPANVTPGPADAATDRHV